MKILVTGSNGFIGKHICDFLEGQNYTLFKIVRRNINGIKNTFEIDLTNSNMGVTFLEEFKAYNNIDCIIHLASKFVNTNQTNNEQFEVLTDNLEITRNVVRIAGVLKPKKIINFSSMAVYPNIDGVYSEESPVRMSDNFDCMYGLSKFCSEIIFDNLLKEENTTITHLRLSQIYGDGMRQDRIIPIMKSELREKNMITVYGEGERISNFIHIKKVLEILHHLILNHNSGVYNVGNESISYLDLAKWIIRDFGNEFSSINKQVVGSRVKFILNTSKLEKLIGEFVSVAP